MRLLNTATYAIEEFYDPIPPYAILSHTWSAREVTLTDIDRSHHDAIQHPSWPKIENAAARARSDGLEWIWIDTCCIDKASSAELSEAINSMFRWYREAEVCYVYLVDYELGGNGGEMGSGSGGRSGGSAGRKVDFVELEKCRWFTRGWTLQELIAPSSRIFFNARWEEIGRLNLRNGKRLSGEEASLLEAVEMITRIPRKVLVLSSTRGYCVAQKMSWASRRSTTRIEDTAYSLLGIFEVNMPLLYGEGKKAFVRLQEEILKKSIDHSLFAWVDMTASRSTYRGLLARSPSEFEMCGDVHYVDGKADPYAMTNKGLHMKLPLEPIQEVQDEFLAYLNCSLTSFKSRLCLRLAKIDENGHYARVNPHDRPLLPVPTVELPLLEIYILQDINLHPEYSSPRAGTITMGSWAFNYPLQKLLPRDIRQTAAWTETQRRLIIPETALGCVVREEYVFTGDFELEYSMLVEFDPDGEKRWKIRWRNELDPDKETEQDDRSLGDGETMAYEDKLRFRFARKKDGTPAVQDVPLRQRAAILGDDLTLVLGKLASGAGHGESGSLSKKGTELSRASTWLSTYSLP